MGEKMKSKQIPPECGEMVYIHELNIYANGSSVEDVVGQLDRIRKELVKGNNRGVGWRLRVSG